MFAKHSAVCCQVSLKTRQEGKNICRNGTEGRILFTNISGTGWVIRLLRAAHDQMLFVFHPEKTSIPTVRSRQENERKSGKESRSFTADFSLNPQVVLCNIGNSCIHSRNAKTSAFHLLGRIISSTSTCSRLKGITREHSINAWERLL